MNFFNSVKRAFGFSADDDEIFEEYDSIDTESSVDSANESDDNPNNSPVALIPENISADNSTVANVAATDSVSTLSGELFDGVIAVFNRALPDFVERCIDRDNQRKVLIESLESTLRQRLADELINARERGRKELWAERARIDEELRELREKNRRLDDRSNETNAARLSAERQKRALVERVHDLEGQVTQLEAEKEQFELETKSLMNRMRVAGVSLTGEATIDDNSFEDTLKKLDDAEKRAKDAEARICEAEKRAKDAEARICEAEKRANDAEARISEAEKRANDAEARISEAEKRANDAEARISEADNPTIAEAEMRAEKAEMRMREQESALVEIERQLSTFEKVRNRLDARISELKEENAFLKARIEDLQSNQSVPYQQIEELQLEDPIAAEPPAPLRRKSSRKKKIAPKISAIDEFMTENDWFGAPTPEEEKAKVQADRMAAANSDEFGYRQPQRKAPPENQDQLSLW